MKKQVNNTNFTSFFFNCTEIPRNVPLKLILHFDWPKGEIFGVGSGINHPGFTTLLSSMHGALSMRQQNLPLHYCSSGWKLYRTYRTMYFWICAHNTFVYVPHTVGRGRQRWGWPPSTRMSPRGRRPAGRRWKSPPQTRTQRFLWYSNKFAVMENLLVSLESWRKCQQKFGNLYLL